MNELESLKPSNSLPGEVNRIVRAIKQVMLHERLDTELVRRFALYQYNQFKHWIEEELNVVKAQRENLLLNLSILDQSKVINKHNGFSSPSVKERDGTKVQILKEIRDLEKQRNSKLEV